MNSLHVLRSHLVYLDQERFAELASKGECSWTWPTGWPHTKQPRQAPGASDLCIALDDSKSHYFLEFEPAQDLDLVLDWSRLVRYVESPARLVLVRQGSLRDVVSEACDGATESQAPERAFLPTKDREDEYGHSYTDAAVERWTSDQELFGQLAICGCSEPGCGATYAWLQGLRCRLLIEVSAAGICRIEVGPFALRSPA